MRANNLISYIFLTLTTLMPGMALGHSYVDLTETANKPDSSQVTGSFIVGKTDYKTKQGSVFTLDRKAIGFSFSYDVGEGTSVFGQMGKIVRTELVDFADFNGDGYEAGAGATTVVYRGAKSVLSGYGRFNFSSEDLSYQNGDARLKSTLDMYEFSVGLLAALHNNPRFHPYAALEVYPINQGKAKSKTDEKSAAAALAKLTADKNAERPDFSKTVEFQRDDILGMRLGASTMLNDFMLKGEMTLITETTFLLGAGFAF